MADGITRKELLSYTRQELTRLGRRLENVAGGNIVSPALQDFLNLQERLTGVGDELDVASVRKTLRSLSDKDLTSVYRDIRYISNLSSSSVRGAKRYESRVAPILDRYTSWDEEKRAKFREVYGKIMETGLSGELFRYSVLELAEIATEKEDTDEIPVRVERLMIELQKLHADDDGEVTANEFLSALQKIR